MSEINLNVRQRPTFIRRESAESSSERGALPARTPSPSGMHPNDRPQALNRHSLPHIYVNERLHSPSRQSVPSGLNFVITNNSSPSAGSPSPSPNEKRRDSYFDAVDILPSAPSRPSSPPVLNIESPPLAYLGRPWMMLPSARGVVGSWMGAHPKEIAVAGSLFALTCWCVGLTVIVRKMQHEAVQDEELLHNAMQYLQHLRGH